MASSSSQLPLSDVITILNPLKDMYFELGVHLEIKPEEINAIEGNHTTISRRFSEIIISWQNNSTGDQRWSTLADAVERVRGHDTIVKKLRALAQNSLSANGSPSLSANVGPSLSANVGQSLSANFGPSLSANVSQSLSADVGPSLSANVGQSLSADVSLSANVSQSLSADVGPSLSANVGQSLSADVGPSLSANVGQSLSADVGPSLSANVGQSLSADVGPSLSANVGQSLSANGGPSLSANVGQSLSANGGPSLSANVGQSLSANGDPCLSANVSQSLLANGGPSLSANVDPNHRVYFTASQNTPVDSRPSQLLTSSDSGNGSASSDEGEPFEFVPGCGCPQDNPCSPYTLCTTGCPNPTTKRVGMLWRKSQPTRQCQFPMDYEPDTEDYEKRTKAIRKLFADLVVETCDSFEKSNVCIHKLTLYLQSASPLMKARASELNAATRMETVFKIVNQACSWFDYELIKDIAYRFGDASVKDRVTQYEIFFKEYAEQRLPEGMKHIEIDVGTMKGAKTLVIKVDEEWKDTSFNRIDEIRGNFASILGVRRRDLFLVSVREGCVMMTFVVPEEFSTKFQTKDCFSSSQLNAFKKAGVIMIKYGKMTWRLSNKAEADKLSTNSNSEVLNVHNKTFTERRRFIINNFCTLLSLILLFIMLVTLLSLTTCVRIVGDRNIFPENQIVLSIQPNGHLNECCTIIKHRPNRDKIDLVTNRTFILIFDELRNVSNAENCFYAVDLSWTDDEVVKHELHSGPLTYLGFRNGSPCETDTVEISDVWANTSVEISPDGELLIDRGSSSTLSCTAPCLIHGDGIEVLLLNYLTADNEEVRSNALKSIFSEIEPVIITGTNCTYAVNVSYSLDEEIRRTLSAVRCTFVYSGSKTTIHRSHSVRIIFTDSPEVPVDLTLQPSLMLQWSRPLNVPSQAPISYTIESNATDGSGMNFRNITSETSFSVQFLEDMLQLTDGECVEFQFFVFATNDAGSGPLARLKDTVPISPDVTNVSNELKVEWVSLQLQLQTASVDISFPPVNPCSENLALTNYTVNIDNAVHVILSPGNVSLGVPLTIGNLTQDGRFSLTITACNNVTCRTFDTKVIKTSVAEIKLRLKFSTKDSQCTVYTANKVETAIQSIFDKVFNCDNITVSFVKQNHCDLLATGTFRASITAYHVRDRAEYLYRNEGVLLFNLMVTEDEKPSIFDDMKVVYAITTLILVVAVLILVTVICPKKYTLKSSDVEYKGDAERGRCSTHGSVRYVKKTNLRPMSIIHLSSPHSSRIPSFPREEDFDFARQNSQLFSCGIILCPPKGDSMLAIVSDLENTTGNAQLSHGLPRATGGQDQSALCHITMSKQVFLKTPRTLLRQASGISLNYSNQRQACTDSPAFFDPRTTPSCCYQSQNSGLIFSKSRKRHHTDNPSTATNLMLHGLDLEGRPSTNSTSSFMGTSRLIRVQHIPSRSREGEKEGGAKREPDVRLTEHLQLQLQQEDGHMRTVMSHRMF